MSLTGKTMRIFWWHEFDYIYSGAGMMGFYTNGWTDLGGKSQYTYDMCIPYNIIVVVGQPYRSKYHITFTNGSVLCAAYIKPQWLTNKVEIPKPGDIVKTRQAQLIGVTSLPDETPRYWRGGARSVILRDRNQPSPMWVVVDAKRGFLQLNTGAWVSCGDVYIPAQIKKLGE